MWTLTTEPSEYAYFLLRLFRHVADGFSWRPVRKIRPLNLGEGGGGGEGGGAGGEGGVRRGRLALPSAEERARRQAGQQQRRAAVSIQTSARRRVLRKRCA